MSNIEDVQREYNMDDLQMLQRAQVFHNGFEDDKLVFSQAFPALADPFAADFQTAIDDADALPSAAEVASMSKYVTEQLNDKMPIARDLMQKLFTYSDWAWNSKAKTEQFGKLEYGKVYNDHNDMKEVLETAARNAMIADNRTALEAAGMPTTLPSEIAALMNAMDNLIEQQQDMLRGTKFKTQQRIEAYNTVWGFMKKINQASKVVFSSNPAKLDFYLLYPGSSQSLPKPQGLVANPDPQDPQTAVLTWNPVDGADSYKIYFSEVALGQPSGNFAEIGQVNGVNIFTSPIIAGRSNYWKIKAYGGGLSSAYSDEVQWDG